MKHDEIIQNIDTIAGHLDVPELLDQLAEEAAELGHAALKLRRALTGTNPTPVKPKRANEQLQEEIADVFACIDVLARAENLDIMDILFKKSEKLARWAERLEQVENG